MQSKSVGKSRTYVFVIGYRVRASARDKELVEKELDVFVAELEILPWLEFEVIQGKATYRNPNKHKHLKINTAQHASNLSVFAFVKRYANNCPVSDFLKTDQFDDAR